METAIIRKPERASTPRARQHRVRGAADTTVSYSPPTNQSGDASIPEDTMSQVIGRRRSRYKPRNGIGISSKCYSRFLRVIALVDKGMTDLAISRELGEHLTTVQRWRTTYGAPHNSPSNYVGDEGEAVVMAELSRRGLSPKKQPNGAPFDILAAGKRIDVKTARAIAWSKKSKSRAAAFNLQSNRKSLRGHSYEKDYAADSDLIICVFLGDEAPAFWIMPTVAVAHKGGLALSLKPSRRTKYDQYRDNWALIGEGLGS